MTPLDPAAPTSDILVLEEARVTVSPNSPVRGDVATVTIEIPNRTSRVWTVSIDADVNPTALFRRASDAPSIRPRVTEAFLGISWPALLIPARSVARVQYEVVLRYEDAGPLVSNIRLSGQDESRTYVAAGANKDFQIETAWGTPDSLDPISLWRFLATAFGLLLLAVPSVMGLWRAARTGADKYRMPLRAGAVTVAAMAIVLSLAISLIIWSDASLRGRYQQSTCQVTDRFLDRRGDSGGSIRTRQPVYALLIAVNMQRPDGIVPGIAGDSDSSPGEMYVEDDARRRFANFVPGESYPCWYHVSRPHEIAMQLEASRLPLYIMSVLLLALSLPGVIHRLPRFRR